MKSGDWCTLLFFLETTDHLDLIYLEDPDGTGATTAGLYDSDGNGIEGDGSAMSPYKINVTMDCSSFPITLYSPADAIVKVTVRCINFVSRDVSLYIFFSFELIYSYVVVYLFIYFFIFIVPRAFLNKVTHTAILATCGFIFG